MNEKTVKYTYRIPPCPSCDVEGVESWLEDMAKQGMLLCRDGIFLGLARFEKAAPRNAAYRLAAAMKSTSMWSDGGGEPDEEEIEASAGLGWEYVSKFGEFYIYRSFDRRSRELNTDPQVQALALNEVKKRGRSAFLDSLYWLLLYPLLFVIFRSRSSVLLTMLSYGTVKFLFSFFTVCLIFADSLVRLNYISRLRKKLLDGQEMDRHKPWKKGAAKYHAARVLMFICCAVTAAGLLQSLGASITDAGETALEDYPGELAFADIFDFAQGEPYYVDMGSFGNKIRTKSDLLAPELTELVQIAGVKTEDGRDIEGYLSVDYMEGRWEWVARAAARDYYRIARSKKEYEPLELPELGADFAVAYRRDLGFEELIVRRGKKLIRASFHSYGGDTYGIELEDWARIMARF